MKKTILAVVAMVALLTTSFAQKKASKLKVPQKITTAFAAEYTSITPKWDNEDGKYEASFEKDNIKMSILYNADGSKEETEIAIPIIDLPKAATTYINNKKMGKIKGAAKITKAEGTIIYEAELKGKDVLFNSEGKYLKIVKD